MALEPIFVRFDVQDQASPAFSRLEKRVGVLERRLNKLNGTSNATDAALRQTATGGTAAASRGFRTLDGIAGNLAGSLGFVGAALAGLQFRQAAQEALSFSRAMAEVATILDGTAEEQERVNATVRRLSVQFGQDPAAQARALYNAVSAGVTDAGEATLFLEQANKLALAGVTDVNTAIEGLLAVMKPYGLETGESARASDLLFATVRRGITTIPQLSASLSQVTPIAAAANVSVEELLGSIAAITEATKAPTAEATTQVRALTQALIEGNAATGRVATQLGITIERFNIDAVAQRGLLGVLQDVDQQLSSLGEVERLEAFKVLFGRVEGLTAALALLGPGAESAARNLAELRNVGGETETALSVVEASSAQRVARLNAAFRDLRIEVGEQLVNSLLGIDENLTTLLNTLNDLIEPVFALGRAALISVDAIGALAGGAAALAQGESLEAVREGVLGTLQSSQSEVFGNLRDAFSGQDAARVQEASAQLGREIANALAGGIERRVEGAFAGVRNRLNEELDAINREAAERLARGAPLPEDRGTAVAERFSERVQADREDAEQAAITAALIEINSIVEEQIRLFNERNQRLVGPRLEGLGFDERQRVLAEQGGFNERAARLDALRDALQRAFLARINQIVDRKEDEQRFAELGLQQDQAKVRLIEAQNRLAVAKLATEDGATRATDEQLAAVRERFAAERAVLNERITILGLQEQETAGTAKALETAARREGVEQRLAALVGEEAAALEKVAAAGAKAFGEDRRRQAAADAQLAAQLLGADAIEAQAALTRLLAANQRSQAATADEVLERSSEEFRLRARLLELEDSRLAIQARAATGAGELAIIEANRERVAAEIRDLGAQQADSVREQLGALRELSREEDERARVARFRLETRAVALQQEQAASRASRAERAAALQQEQAALSAGRAERAAALEDGEAGVAAVRREFAARQEQVALQRQSAELAREDAEARLSAVEAERQRVALAAESVQRNREAAALAQEARSVRLDLVEIQSRLRDLGEESALLAREETVEIEKTRAKLEEKQRLAALSVAGAENEIAVLENRAALEEASAALRRGNFETVEALQGALREVFELERAALGLQADGLIIRRDQETDANRAAVFEAERLGLAQALLALLSKQAEKLADQTEEFEKQAAARQKAAAEADFAPVLGAIDVQLFEAEARLSREIAANRRQEFETTEALSAAVNERFALQRRVLELEQIQLTARANLARLTGAAEEDRNLLLAQAAEKARQLKDLEDERLDTLQKETAELEEQNAKKEEKLRLEALSALNAENEAALIRARGELELQQGFAAAGRAQGEEVLESAIRREFELRRGVLDLEIEGLRIQAEKVAGSEAEAAAVARLEVAERRRALLNAQEDAAVARRGQEPARRVRVAAPSRDAFDLELQRQAVAAQSALEIANRVRALAGEARSVEEVTEAVNQRFALERRIAELEIARLENQAFLADAGEEQNLLLERAAALRAAAGLAEQERAAAVREQVQAFHERAARQREALAVLRAEVEGQRELEALRAAGARESEIAAAEGEARLAVLEAQLAAARESSALAEAAGQDELERAAALERIRELEGEIAAATRETAASVQRLVVDETTLSTLTVARLEAEGQLARLRGLVAQDESLSADLRRRAIDAEFVLRERLLELERDRLAAEAALLGPGRERIENLARQSILETQLADLTEERQARIAALAEDTDNLADRFAAGFGVDLDTSAAQQNLDTLADAAEELGQALSSALTDGLRQFIETGEFDFREFLQGLLADFQEIFINNVAQILANQLFAPAAGQQTTAQAGGALGTLVNAILGGQQGAPAAGGGEGGDVAALADRALDAADRAETAADAANVSETAAGVFSEASSASSEVARIAQTASEAGAAASQTSQTAASLSETGAAVAEAGSSLAATSSSASSLSSASSSLSSATSSTSSAASAVQAETAAVRAETAAATAGGGGFGVGGAIGLGVTLGTIIGGLIVNRHQGGIIPRFHAGGRARLSGLESDEVNAVLQTGEFVMSRRGVQAAGLALLDGINRGSGGFNGLGPSLAERGTTSSGQDARDRAIPFISDATVRNIVQSGMGEREIRRIVREENGRA